MTWLVFMPYKYDKIHVARTALVLVGHFIRNMTRLTTHLSRVVRKPTFCICENKDADQLRGNREADQRLCFRYIDSTIPLLSKSEISSLYTSSAVVRPSLCRTRSETRTLVFSRRGSFITCKGYIVRWFKWSIFPTFEIIMLLLCCCCM